jgi:hypothetical protein
MRTPLALDIPDPQLATGSAKHQLAGIGSEGEAFEPRLVES